MTTITRRGTLQLMSAAGAGLFLPGMGGGLAAAQQGRSLDAQILGFTLAIHVPAIVALNDGMVELGYGPSEMARIESMQVVTQSIVSGSAEVGEADIISAMRAAGAGADVKLTGLVYNNTSQVLVVDADRVSSLADLANPANPIALSSTGDFIYVMLAGAMARENVSIDDVTTVEIGGSGSRMRALLGGRVAGVPVHFDQAQQIMQEGNYKVLVEPWTIFDPWLSEAWLCNGRWLENADNERMMIDLVKATITSFRRANESYDYFAEGYRKFSTAADAATVTDETLRPIWEQLSQTIRAWPDDGGFRREYFEQLLPEYRNAGVLSANLDIGSVVDTTYVERALTELGPRP